jgi:hypothetical protein
MVQMALFHDEFETTTVKFGEKDWVKLRPLPRSFFDKEEKEILSVTEGINIKGFKNGQFEIDGNELKSDALKKVTEKQKELEYEKIKQSIVEWSSDREVSIENIKKLPNTIYDKVYDEIEKINHLTGEEVKN